MSDGNEEQSPEELLAAFSFSPDWAKASVDDNSAKIGLMASKFERNEAGAGAEREKRSFGHREFSRSARRDEADRGGAWRKPRRERDGDTRDFNGERRSSGGRQSGFGGAPRQMQFEENGTGHHHRDMNGGVARRQHKPWTPPPFTVRFVPDQTALNLVAHKILGSHKAMPLKEIVRIFFANPDSTLVRVEWDDEHKDLKFHQCRKCEWFTEDENELKKHLVAAHFTDFFTPVEIEVDPPSGSFTAVAKCGITGKLLAPPNHHSYNRRIAEMLATPECAGISEAEYRSRIERVTDPEAIEQWRKEASKQIVWALKSENTQKPETQASLKEAEKPETGDNTAESANSGEPVETEKPENAEQTVETEKPETSAQKYYSRDEAEALFLTKFAPEMMRHGRQATASRSASSSMEGGRILAEIRHAWDHEQRIPVSSLHFAIRGGLKARRLAVFRLPGSPNKRDEFVAPRAPTPLNATSTVPELREILDWASSHPDATKAELMAALLPDGTSEARVSAIKKQLAFLLDRGHLVEFTSGRLSVPQAQAVHAPDAPSAEEPMQE